MGTEPEAQHPAAVSLNETEQDELNNRVLSGEADESARTGDTEVARLDSYVLLEVDADQHVELHPDPQAAQSRYEELKDRYVEPPAEPGSQ